MLPSLAMIPLDRTGGHVLAVAALMLALEVRVHLHACNIGNMEVISRQYQMHPIGLDAYRQMTKSAEATGHPPLCIVLRRPAKGMAGGCTSRW